MGSQVRISLRTLVMGWGVGCCLLLGVRDAAAIALDENHNISLRARLYTQAAIRISDSDLDTVPTTKAGQLVQHRNFYNPELDAKLTDYMSFMKGPVLGFLRPDDFSFRIAAWGFYDGVYDYAAKQFGKQQAIINRTYPNPDLKSAFILEGDHFSCPARGGANQECFRGLNPNVPYSSVNQLFPGSHPIRPRDIYAHEARVNELYLSYNNGPVFLRIGRQAISWGEADTIGLLDQNNPFDITRGAPGFFQDLDEARIPLWTIRASYDLFDKIGPFSSGFIEAYWVPGAIDTTTSTLPVLTASPYSPRGQDPQATIDALGLAIPIEFVLFDRTPEKKMSNSRYGFRFQTVIADNHTLSLYYYTHFPNQPAPRSRGLARTNLLSESGQPIRFFTTETVHELTSVWGVSDTFFVESIDSILRGTVQYFDNEPGFVPEISLGTDQGDPLKLLSHVGSAPGANIIRWEAGLDRFFFLRALNPSNSFTLATAVVGAWNLDERNNKDYRFAGQRKEGARGDLADDFVQLKAVEVFGQIRLQTSYMHGKLEPGITLIWNARGTHGVNPEVNYRVNDSLILGLDIAYIGGEYQQLGFYKDRDQVALRATYQLN